MAGSGSKPARRTFRRRLATSQSVPPAATVIRRYLDLAGHSLLVHVAKHVLDRRAEEWAEILGMPLPVISAKAKDALTVLETGRLLSNAVKELRKQFGDSWSIVFDYLLCKKEVDALRNAAADLGKVRPQAQILEKLKPEDLSPYLQEVGEFIEVTEKTMKPGATSELTLSLLALDRNGLLSAFFRVVTNSDELDAALASSAPPPAQVVHIANARKAVTGTAGLFLASWASKTREQSRVLEEELKLTLGNNFEYVIGSYLEAGWAAATEAGLTPRHCVYDKPYDKGVEAYLDSKGVVIVLGNNRAGERETLTIHRPVSGRGAKEKALSAANIEAVRSNYGPRAQRAAREFMKQLKDWPRTFFSPETWLA